MKDTAFPITEGDVAAELDDSKVKVRPLQKKSRLHALNEDVIWALEMDISRYRQTLEGRQGPLTDKEHGRLLKTAEQLRKLRATDADIQRQNSTSELEDFELDAEFDERCNDLGLDPDAVLEALGLSR